ncbi:hypothetical protein A1O7_03684 [Cladophialophora yegresii CBS 114405]|uniref:Mid2 domain-containing protein n=1 Tax=Cladophialophora yegresii CBS 114405 TaxID=1182544 RepID=W9W590_9EURO|nr:uncharacterized protein A1O7_03684 [Cladophialophora yegresii CBS 114405]EXJ63237.1 hypothetical protein A1O7_03684 [Cladophialophora yegresii CBS 114405]
MYNTFFAIAIFLFAHVLCQTPSTYFVNPPAAGGELFFAENKAYAVGSVIDIQWVTDEDDYNIFLWQQSLGVQSAAEGSGPIYTKILGSDEEGGFSWTVTPQQFSLNQSNVFFLALTPAGAQDLDGATTSHYINLTAASDTAPLNTTPLVSSPASSTLAPSTQATSTSKPTTTATATSTPSPVPPAPQTASPSTSSSSTTIGVGVGLGLGIPLLLLIGFIAIPRRYRRKLFAAKPPSYANSIDRDNVYTFSAQPAKSYIGELPSRELGHSSLAESRPNVHAEAVELDGWQMRMSRAGRTVANNS